VSTVPACGVAGRWATGCNRSSLGTLCVPVQADRVQSCR
jgi:hypothetical protein